MSGTQTAINVIEGFTNRNLHITKNCCLSSRNRNSGCTRCIDVCPAGCISRDPQRGTVFFAAEKCLSCGTCATACPSGALRVKSPSENEVYQACVNAAAANNNKLVVLCQSLASRAGRMVDADKVAVVPCHGRLDESLLMALVSLGIESITLVQGECEGCNLVNSVELAKRVQENVAAVLSAWSVENPIRMVSKIPSSVRAGKDSYDSDRRNFFGGLRSDVKDAAAIGAQATMADKFGMQQEEEKLQPVNEKGVMYQEIPPRQRRLNAIFAELGDPDEGATVTSRLWGQVTIDTNKCRACLMCATFCLTGALSRFKNEDGTVGVSFQPGICVQCRTCENICLGHAITVSDEVAASCIVNPSTTEIQMGDEMEQLNGAATYNRSIRNLLGGKNVYIS